MQSVLKKQDKDYVININTMEESKKEKESSPKRDHPKVEKYMTLIGQLLNFNSSMSNPGHIAADSIDAFNDKRRNLQSNKNNVNENQEQKFSITQLKDRNENLETHKKGFFVITDELREEEDDMSLKLKREILVGKLMYDKSIIVDKQMQSDFNDGILSSVFLTLSNESRKLLNDQLTDYSHDYNLFNNLIGWDKEKASKNFQVTNEMIMHMCEKLVKFEDLQPGEEQEKLGSTHNLVNKSVAEERGSLSGKPILEKFVVEDEKKDHSKLLSLHSVEIKNEQQIEIATKTLEEDEDFDEAEYNFFLDFIQNNQDHPIKDKIEKILNIISASNAANKPGKKPALTNKMKNEILRNLKANYLRELEQLEKIEEEKRKKEEEEELQKKKEEELKRKRNFRIENPFEETLDVDHKIQRAKANNKTDDSSVQSPLKNKVIYTNQGWGISDFAKKSPITNPNSVLATSKNIEKGNKQRSSPPGDKRKGNLRYKANQDVKKQNGIKKVVKSGNQKIIYTDKNNNLKSQNNNSDGHWMGGGNDSDSSGEWVEHKR